MTGVCLMAMEAGLDTGPVFACDEIAIGASESAGELHDRVAAAGGALLVSHLDDIVSGDLASVPQDDALATYAPKIKSADAELDWKETAENLARKVRAYNPVPGAWFMVGDERVKCWTAECAAAVDAPPGTVVVAGKDGVDVSCADGVLRLQSLQRPGKRAVSAAEFASQVDLSGRQL